MMLTMPGPRLATTAIASSIEGMLMKTSITRMMTLSSLPPK